VLTLNPEYTLDWAHHRQRRTINHRCQTVRGRRRRLFGYIRRADSTQDHSRPSRACLSGLPKKWKRRPGWPRQTWLRTVEGSFISAWRDPQFRKS